MEELDVVPGYSKVYDYTQFSHDNHVNVIPEEAFQRLVRDTFGTITNVLRRTYGPYGSTIMISADNDTTTTKDGYNIYCSMGFSHQYKNKVYLAIKNIIERVNRTVGDGTTSCILLAEKVFNKLLPVMNSADNKRNLKKILDSLEYELQNSLAIKRDLENGLIKELTEEQLRNIINLASNYDEKLVNILMEAFDPQVENGYVTGIRNVIVDADSRYDTSSNASYKIDLLPGDYRVRIDMDTDFALGLNKPGKMKVLVYDHTFGPSEWEAFIKNYDKTTYTMIFARSFKKTFMDNEYLRYLKGTQLTKTPVTVYLASVLGDHVQDELHDLAAVLGTEIRDIHMLEVKHDELPWANLQVFNYNCLCVSGCKRPDEYIKKLEMDLENEKSVVRRSQISDRIDALGLEKKDTLLTVRAGTKLELKMITDKIDDCASIAKSAFNYGVVPNMLWYANERVSREQVRIMNELKNNDDLSRNDRVYNEFYEKICSVICEAIEELFVDIWTSKYGDERVDERESFKAKFYTSEYPNYSFDILGDSLVDMCNLPTSAQYDLEVLVATLSIVKYLLTSRAFIFDSYLMRQQGDQGRFIRDDDF
jgi:chaperonin GroEL (HSP60 family)